MSGKVYIVGAGPGDVGLLTVKGLRCLQKAEVVLYDFHLNAQILNYINQDAEFIYAGKCGGHHAMTQDEINQSLINKAKQGKVVCRLKGGDPFVFGRGGEEAEAIAKEGIPFEIVPGVSSAIAAPAYAGIPLTHRLYSSSFAVVPGHEDPTKKESSIDYEKLSTGVGTIVFLMTVKNIADVTRKLVEGGRDPKTPVAVIRWGTRADQRTIISSLDEIAGVVMEEDIRPPSVMVVGDVVRLRDTLKWYESLPMFGHRVLVTREHSEGFEVIEELGAEIIEFPTIEVVPPESYAELDNAIDEIGTYNWLIFTSATAVRFFFERYFQKGKDIRDLKGIKLCAIGSKTGEAISRYGIRVDLIPRSFNAEGLIEAFLKAARSQKSEVRSLKGIRILLPRAEKAREIFPEEVRKMGGRIDVVTAYRTIRPDTKGRRLRRFLREGRITVATFTSAATFENFLAIFGDEAIDFLRDTIIAVIGPVTAKAIEKAGLKVHIMPEEATIDALVKGIIGYVLT